MMSNNYAANVTQMTASGDLVIRDVSWSKNMGLYKCRVHNDHGSDHTSTFLYPVSDDIWHAQSLHIN